MSRGITLHLESAVTAFEKNSTDAIGVKLNTGPALETDMVIFAAGVRPRTELAVDAGLTIGEFGGILVDERMQTSDRHIWAVGDAAEVRNVITGRSCMVPLAGPANRQGRIAANIMRGHARIGHWENLTDPGVFILDVRDIEECRQGHLENAVNIPLEDLRECLDEQPRDREIWVHCYVGQRSYFAARILRQHGFKVKYISGGYLMYDPVKRYKRNY